MGEGQRWAPWRLSLATPELAARGQSYPAHGWTGLAWADSLRLLMTLHLLAPRGSACPNWHILRAGHTTVNETVKVPCLRVPEPPVMGGRQ